MQIGGDKQILETISREIQFAKEKEVIAKLLINKQVQNEDGGASPRKATQALDKARQLKAKQEAHESKVID